MLTTLKALGARAVRGHVGRKWDDTTRAAATRSRWWHSPALKAYVDARVDPATGGGVPGALAARLAGRPAVRAISVGAGEGSKERALVAAGLVGRFELSRAALRPRPRGRRRGRPRRAHGVPRRRRLRPGPRAYDLVHALHHMLDVAAALAWSVAVLAPGGLLVVNDYVGRPGCNGPRRRCASPGPSWPPPRRISAGRRR